MYYEVNSSVFAGSLMTTLFLMYLLTTKGPDVVAIARERNMVQLCELVGEELEALIVRLCLLVSKVMVKGQGNRNVSDDLQ